MPEAPEATTASNEAAMPSSNQPAKATSVTRDVLKAAAEKAMKAAEPVKVVEADPAATEAPASSDETAETETVDAAPSATASKEPSLIERLRAREKAHQLKMREQGTYSRKSMEIQQQQQEIARMKAEAQSNLDYAKTERARLEKLKTEPFEAIKELGWSTKDLVDGVVKHGSPEWKAQQAMAQQQALIDQRLAKLDEITKQQETAAQKAEQARIAIQKEQTEKAFIARATDEAKFSALNTLYQPQEILRMAYEVQNEYHQLTGEVATDADIAEYMNHKAQERLEGIRRKLGGSGIAPKNGKAKGPNALSNSAASERRSVPKSTARMSTSDRLKEMRKAAEEAMRQRV